ncbi:MAG: thioredoxin family protein [Dysgonamonadaceae bacterium]|jgi:thiol:disulfide interchange protein DsbD|nr:thioredoxin family protein [Dysgonamonadaceae bacterium]
MKKFVMIISCLIILLNGITAQIYEPVKWSFKVVGENAAEMVLHFTATIDRGWHIYDMQLPENGPIPTSFTFESVEGATLTGKLSATTPAQLKISAVFDNMELRQYENTVTFVQKIHLKDSNRFTIKGYVTFMACDDERCLAPEDIPFTFEKQLSDKAATTTTAQQPAATTAALPQSTPAIPVSTPDTVVPLVADAPVVSGHLPEADIWSPVIDELRVVEQKGDVQDNSWWYLFIGGFVGGILAFLTPCVWPMIPMTVSFFLKRSKSRKKSLTDTLLYALSIIVIYLLLGIIVTVIFGASALNELSTSAGINLLFFVLLVVFSASFLGMFDLTLPASWTNKLDKKADAATGFLSIFLMAFTLVLVSFSCTGPIIGTLLVEAAAKGSQVGPAVGMFGFALALSIPFALFALFPSRMQSMPKSGGWLQSVKVVLGFLELALALKFLSVADLANHWGILDREVFLVLWMVIFALLGFYLLGKIKLVHDSDLKQITIPRLFLAIVSFSFVIYMLPGLWGAPLKAISAFSPPLYTQDFNLYTGEVLPQFKDYEAGMEYARKKGKPVMIDFTGYGCVNCRNMEASVWTDPRVKDLIDNNYVLISLYVDDKENLPQTIAIEESGKKRNLKTIGDKWSYLQRHKFGTNAQPYYVLLDNSGKPVAPSRTYDKNIEEYIRFLKKGLEQYKQ